MLLYAAIIAAVLIVAVLLRFLAEPDTPEGGWEHQSVDEPRDPDPPELLAAA